MGGILVIVMKNRIELNPGTSEKVFKAVPETLVPCFFDKPVEKQGIAFLVPETSQSDDLGESLPQYVLSMDVSHCLKGGT